MNTQPDSSMQFLKGCGCITGILLVLGFIAFPLIAQWHTHPPRTPSCMANMNQIAKAMLSYCGEYDDCFPCTRAPGVAGGLQPERGIKARTGVVPFGGTTWVEKVDPYLMKGSVEDAERGIMRGVFNCPKREEKWPEGVGQDTPDWHSYGYNFLYLGLPWSKNEAPKTNPYRVWGFVTGVQRVSRLDNTAHTIMLVESLSIWAFPPFTADGRALPSNRTCISPRHNDKANVAFCDGHTKAIDGVDLVTNRRTAKTGEQGRAMNNYLWEPVKVHKQQEASE